MLGLVTEVHRMHVNERLALVEMVGEVIDGRAPCAVTVGEPSARGRIDFARAARRAGADWVILQPPAVRGASEADVIAMFGAVADAVALPVAVQNNPVNRDVSLSENGLVTLKTLHPTIAILEGEGWSIDIARAIEASDGAHAVFGGHGGIEFPALLRSGGRGLIPAPDFLAAQACIYALWREGTDIALSEAREIHRRVLPAIFFMSRSPPGMLCCGKRLFAAQAGVAPALDRAPALAPSDVGLAETARHRAEIDAALRPVERADA